MALLGKAAVVIWCEVEPAMRAEHDAWHSGEHLPERMATPGFLRGRRTVAADTAARRPYFILYEVEDASVMTSAAYLERRPGVIGAHLLERDQSVQRPRTNERKDCGVAAATRRSSACSSSRGTMAPGSSSRSLAKASLPIAIFCPI